MTASQANGGERPVRTAHPVTLALPTNMTKISLKRTLCSLSWNIPMERRQSVDASVA